MGGNIVFFFFCIGLVFVTEEESNYLGGFFRVGFRSILVVKVVLGMGGNGRVEARV